jgi:hypothetical protein
MGSSRSSARDSRSTAAAGRIEKKIELHGVGKGARRRLDRLQPAVQRRDRARRLRAVATIALDRPLRGLDPEQHVGARGIAAFAGQRAGKVGGRRSLPRELLRPVRPGHAQGGGQIVEGAGELAGRNEMRAPVVGQGDQRLAGEGQAVAGAGDDARPPIGPVGSRAAP